MSYSSTREERPNVGGDPDRSGNDALPLKGCMHSFVVSFQRSNDKSKQQMRESYEGTHVFPYQGYSFCAVHFEHGNRVDSWLRVHGCVCVCIRGQTAESFEPGGWLQPAWYVTGGLSKGCPACGCEDIFELRCGKLRLYVGFVCQVREYGCACVSTRAGLKQTETSV